MSDSEIIALAGWLALLAVGLWLMFSPIRKTQGVEQRIEPVFPERIVSPTMRGTSADSQPDNGGKLVPGGLSSTSEQQVPPDDTMDSGEPPAELRERSGETSSGEATRESNGDKEHPEVRAIATARNDGGGVDAKSDSAGLRVEGMAKAESGPEKKSDAGAATSLGGAEKSSRGDERVSASAERNASPSSILDPSAVASVIRQKTPLGSLVDDCELLSRYFLRKHIAPDAIGNEALTPESVEVPASSYFGDYHHRYSVALSDALKNVETDVARRYLETRRFPHDYVVSFFDETLVVTLSPELASPEFLTISPVDPDYEEFFGSLLSSSRITELFVGAAAERDGELRLYRELDRILEHFRAVERG